MNPLKRDKVFKMQWLMDTSVQKGKDRKKTMNQRDKAPEKQVILFKK